jgi:hypothetical protein
MTFWDKLRQAFGNQVLVEEDTLLETFCKNNYAEIPKIAYKNKRDIQSVDIDIYLNELITPRAFEVDKLFHGVYPSGPNMVVALGVGNVVGTTITWKDDINLSKSGDYYLYPNETIALGWGDCEDHAFVVSSAAREIGAAWGFYKGGGHCFNLFVANDKIFILDTTGGGAYISEWIPGKSDYDIYYIVTSRYTFLVKGGIQFGQIAGWS